MANASTPQPLFISYSRADKDFVSRLIADLQRQGINVWIDKRGLKPGTRNWEQALRDAISSSWAVILVASPDSRRSNYVQDELSIAEMYKRPVFPLWAAGSEWMDCIPMGMGKIQYVDARAERYASALSELVETLNNTAMAAPVIDVRPTPPDFVPRNPYKGLAPFRGEDQGDFFGREGLITTLVERIKATQQKNAPRFLAVVGPSGSGKSSVVMAGLLPRLQDGVLPGSKNWLYLQPMVPGTTPVKSLAITLSRALPARSIKTILEDLEEVSGLGLVVQSLITRPDSRVVLVVDQFEELFTQTTNETERQQFIDLLTTAATEPSNPLLVILTLRADFYDKPMNYAALLNLLKDHNEPVPPMSLADLRDVIEMPAALPDVQMKFDDGLVAELVFEVREQAGALPLLQFTLDQLFERREGQRMTGAAYHEIGGVRGALAKHAEAAYLALPSDEHRRLAQALFLRLIEPGATEQETTRRRAAFSELTLPDARQSQIIREAADCFVRARLLTTDQIGETTTLEVSHEALIREWARLGDWLKNARDDVRLQKAISQDTAQWVGRGRKADDDGLYRGTVLINAQDWTRRSVPSADEVTFIDAGIAREAEIAAEEERRKQELDAAAARAERATRIIVMVGLVALLILIAAVIGVVTANNATTQANAQAFAAGETLTPVGPTLTAVQSTLQAGSNQLLTATFAQGQAVGKAATAAAQAQIVGATLTPFGPTLTAVQSTLQAGSNQLLTATFAQGQALNSVATAQKQVAYAGATLTPVAQKAAALDMEAQAVAELNRPDANVELAALLAIRSLKGAYYSVADKALLQASQQLYALRTFSGHIDIVASVAFSPDGRRVLTGSEDRMAGLWDADSGALLRVLYGHTGAVASVAFSPDGKRVLTGSGDGTARLWDADSGQLLRTFSGHTDTVRSAVFSPDGKRVLTGSADHTARLWDVDSGQTLHTFGGHTDKVSSVVFSPDGKRVLTGSYDHMVRLWDAESGQLLRTFSDYSGVVYSVAFSPDGKRVLTGGDDQTVLLWDADNGQSLRSLSGHTDTLTSVVFSPDGRRVLTSSADHTARLWDVDSGQILRTFSGHTDMVWSAVFSPDGKRVLTGSGLTARLWDADCERPLRTFSGHSDWVYSVAFSPDGKRVLTGSGDRTARLWDVDSRQTLRTFSGHTDAVSSVAFSPDGERILTGSYDQTARLWDVDSGQTLRTFSGHTSWVSSVAFSPDGKRVLTGSYDHMVRLWDAGSGQLLRRFSGHTDTVWSVAFSPDGKHVLTGSYDHMVRLWDVDSGQVLRTFSGHTNGVASVAFSPDGKHVLTGGMDMTARVWDVDSGQLLRTFSGHTNTVTSVAFSPDGKRVLTGSADRTARLWDVDSGQVLRTFSGHTGIVPSAAFSPDGRLVITGSNDQTVRLWDVDFRDLVDYVCSRLLRDFTDEERKAAGITDHEPTCPRFATAEMPITLPLPTTTPQGNNLPVWTPIASPTIAPTNSPSPSPLPSITPIPATPTASPTLAASVFETHNAQRYVTDDGAFALALPPDWKPHTYRGNPGYYFFPGQSGPSLCVLIAEPAVIYEELFKLKGTFDTPTAALESYADSLTGDDFRVVKLAPSTIGTLTGMGFRVTWVSEKEEDDLRVAGLPNGKVIYVFATANTDIWDRAQPVLDFMIDSIRVEGQGMEGTPAPTLTAAP